MTAAIKACEYAKQVGFNEISIVTDSKYLFSAATLWIDKWKNNQWKDNKNKDVVNTELFKLLLRAKENLDINWIHVKGHGDNAGNIRADMLAKSILDPKAETLLAMQRSTSSLQHNNSEIEGLKSRINEGLENYLRIVDGVVYHIDNKLPEDSQHRIYVPKSSRHWLLNLAHGDEKFGGHLGIKKTYRKLLKFWWPGIHQDVESYVKSCDICQQFKNPVGLPPGYMHNIPISEIFEHLHIDIVGPLTTTHRGNCYVITATDAYSKWAFAVPSQKVRTSELIKFVEDSILAVHGKPIRIITDRGTQFTSVEWKEFISKMDIEHKLTTPYHPQSNGIDERLNGTLMRILRSYVNRYQNDWDDHLKWSLYVYNNTVHDSTGYSPYQVLHSRDPRSPLRPKTVDQPEVKHAVLTESIRNNVIERIKLSQENQKKYYDRHRSKPKFYRGQLVYIKTNAQPTYLCKKFYQKWSGPVVITSFVGNDDNPKAICVFDFVNMLKKIVAISDVKPMIDSYKEPQQDQIITQNGEGHTLNDSSDSRYSDYDSPGYYVQTGNTEANDRSSTSQNENINTQDDDTLNITRNTFEGPMTSSPRRVTISNNVLRHFYDPEGRTLMLNDKNVIEETQETSPSNLNEPQQQPHNTSVFDYDNSQKDPIYKPPTQVAHRVATSESRPIDTTSSQQVTPRYITRSVARSRAMQESSGPKRQSIALTDYPLPESDDSDQEQNT